MSCCHFSAGEMEILFGRQKPSTRLILWALWLLELSFMVEYCKEKDNTASNTYSGAPVYDPHTCCRATLQRDTCKNLLVTEEIWMAPWEDVDIQNMYEEIMETGEMSENPTSKFTVFTQISIPSSLGQQIIYHHQDDPFSGNVRRNKTFERLQALVY